MPSAAEELLVKIDASTESLRRELKKGEDAVSSFKTNVDRKLSDLQGVIGGVGSGLRTAIGAFGIGLGVSELVSFSRSVLQFADNLDDTAGQLQVSTEYLQEMRYAAEQTGVETSALENAIAKLNGRIGDAVSGQKTAVKSFERVGIAFKNTDGSARSAEQVIADLADRIKSLPDPAQRAAAAAEILGEKAGPRLVALLSAGSEGLADWQKRAHDAGQVWDSETLKRLADAEQKLKDLQLRATIAAGAVVGFFLSLDNPQESARKELLTVNAELEKWQANLKSVQEGGFLGIVSKVLGTDEAPLEHINKLLERRNQLLGIIGGGRTKDDTIPPATTPPPTDLGSGEPDTEAEQAAKRLQAALHDLNMEVDALTGTEGDNRLAKWLDKAGSAATPEDVLTITDLVNQLTRADIATEGLAAARAADKEAGEEWNRVMQEGATLTESVRTPLEAYNAELARSKYLLDQGIISQETYNRVVDKAGDDFVAADEKSQRLIQSAGQLGSGFVNAFGRIGQAGNDLDNVLQGLLETLAQVAANLAGGGLESLLGDIIKAGLPAAGSALSSDIDAMILANPEIFRDGGIMTGHGRVPLRRYSAGGVARTPQMAMFAEGGVPEAYVPVPSGRIPVELRGGDRGAPTFNVVQHFNVSGGTREQNQDAADRTARAAERAMSDFVDRRILYNQHEGGLFWQHTVD